MQMRYARLAVGLFVIFFLTPQIVRGFASDQRGLESGLAVTDPAVLVNLNLVFGVGNLLGGRERHSDTLMYNNNLFHPGTAGNTTRSTDGYRKIDLSAIRAFVESNIATYEKTKIQGSSIGQHFNVAQKASLGASTELPLEVIDAGFLDRVGRFDLVAIVNRIDKAFKKPETCGELRFIYRLYYEGETVPAVEDVGKIKPAIVRSRLPMTMNLVLHMRRMGDDRISCQDLAKKWIAAGRMASTLSPKRFADFLVSRAGPLDPKQHVTQAQFDRIEFNLQILRAPASFVQDFGTRADYLLGLFEYNSSTASFAKAASLDNQIDRDRLSTAVGNSDRQRLKDWLLRADNLRALDSGTLEIPKDLTAISTVSVSPGGIARSQNQHVFGLFDAGFEQRMRDLIGVVNGSAAPLENIKSYDGFYARINDISCTGCHQTRSIAGFHLPGADYPDSPRENSVFVPGSAHFYGDLPRRRAILDAVAAGQEPTYATGYAARPQRKFATALAGTQLLGGWGSSCFSQADAGSDPTFNDWDCNGGLQCRVFNVSRYHKGVGTCTFPPPARVGDPLQVMKFYYGATGRPIDRDFLEVPPRPATPPGDFVTAHQEWEVRDSTGGFPNGMLRRKPEIASCEHASRASPPRPSEAVCALVADTGFNKCLTRYPFEKCVAHCARPGFLRACTATTPCRDDYICVRTAAEGTGACIPPYFVFQFRVDRHPSLHQASQGTKLRYLSSDEIRRRIRNLTRDASDDPPIMCPRRAG
jgi:hypothetical protein